MKKTTRISIYIICFAVVTAAILFWLDLRQYADQPADTNRSAKIITIHPGDGFHKIVQTLSSENIILEPKKFKLIARIKRYDKKIKAGEYQLSPAMTPNEIFDIMINGKVNLYQLTIPEGYSLKQIAEIAEKNGFCSSREFLAAARNPDLLLQKDIKADSFEGYLFPDTYPFSKTAAPEKIITTMFNRFQSIYSPEWKKRTSELGFSIHQIVTLASMIEKETGVIEEQPIISSVFHNRLKRRMRLQSDPTVIYGIKNFDGNITRAHLEKKTPYNTYKISGLPAGPIANPGANAIEAALYPSETPYLYFVSKKDSTHQFSSNIKDHNRAVRQYQLNRK